MSSAPGVEYWVVTVPNRGDPAEQTYGKLSRCTASSRNDFADIHQIDVPQLVVGTLDSLMNLSDDLVRVDAGIESLVKRVERQYQDIEDKRSADELKIAGQPVDRYIPNFSWDYARYPPRRTLPELVALIQAGTSKIDDELKTLSAAYTEKQQAVAALKRKKAGSLMSSALEEVITEDVIRGVEFLDTEFLLTLVVIVPKSNEQDWLTTYESLGADIAGFNNPDWTGANGRNIGKNDGQFGPKTQRNQTKGSPVVPGSTRKLMEDQEAALYTVTILKGQYEAGFYTDDEWQPGVFSDYVEEFKNKAREKRFVVRNFKFDPNAVQAAKTALDRSTVELQQMHTQLVKWCKAHYGEAMTAWMHVKVIKTFVEAVLRYGLPVDYLTVIYRPKSKREKQLQQTLDQMYADSASPLSRPGGEDDDKEAGDYLPYVLQKFCPFAAR